jgi:hypothetical protein
MRSTTIAIVANSVAHVGGTSALSTLAMRHRTRVRTADRCSGGSAGHRTCCADRSSWTHQRHLRRRSQTCPPLRFLPSTHTHQQFRRRHTRLRRISRMRPLRILRTLPLRTRNQRTRRLRNPRTRSLRSSPHTRCRRTRLFVLLWALLPPRDHHMRTRRRTLPRRATRLSTRVFLRNSTFPSARPRTPARR